MNRATRRLSLAVGAFLSVPTGSFGQVAAAPALPDMGYSMVRVVGALAVVFALFFGALWLFRNWQRISGQTIKSPKLAVLEVKSLGNRNALYVVAYERQRMLLASSSSGVALVSHLPESDAEESEPVQTSFAASLQQILARKS